MSNQVIATARVNTVEVLQGFDTMSQASNDPEVLRSNNNSSLSQSKMRGNAKAQFASLNNQPTQVGSLLYTGQHFAKNVKA